MIEKKLDEYTGAPEDEAMGLHDRVVEATRLANIELKNKDGAKGLVSQKDLQDDEEADGDMGVFGKPGMKRKK